MRMPILSTVCYVAVNFAFGQSLIDIAPRSVTFSATLDGPKSSVQTVNLGVVGGGGVQFTYDHIEPIVNNSPNFVVLPQSAGIAPTNVTIGLNESVVRHMAPGPYTLGLFFTTTNQSPNSLAIVRVMLNLAFGSTSTIQSIVNTASYQPIVSPGSNVKYLDLS